MSAKIVAEEDTDMNRDRVILIVSLFSGFTSLGKRLPENFTPMMKPNFFTNSVRSLLFTVFLFVLTWAASCHAYEYDHLNAIWGSSGSDVFAVGTNGTILHSHGWNWLPMLSGTLENLRGVGGSSGSDVYAVGTNGTILHYDGATWTPMLSGTLSGLYSVWGSSGSDVFVVGGEIILHYDGSDWSEMEYGDSWYMPFLQDIWGSSGSDVFAVGNFVSGGSYVTEMRLHYNGTTWSSAGSGDLGSLSAISGSSGSDVFTLGYGHLTYHSWEVIEYYDGSDWSVILRRDTTGQDKMTTLNDIWGSSSNDVFVVGDSGKIIHYDGAVWTQMFPPQRGSPWAMFLPAMTSTK